MSSILWILPSLEHIPSHVIPLHCVLIFSAIFITITLRFMFIPLFPSLVYDLPDYVVHLYTPRDWFYQCIALKGTLVLKTCDFPVSWAYILVTNLLHIPIFFYCPVYILNSLSVNLTTCSPLYTTCTSFLLLISSAWNVFLLSPY